MKKLLLLLYAAFLGLCFACEYRPSGEHFEEINPNPEIFAEMKLDPEKDTITVQGNLKVGFSISLPARELFGYQLLLDGHVISEGNSQSGSYYLQSAQYTDGYHTLRLSAITNLGSGSLGDKSGAELIEIYRTWVIYIDNAPPSAVAITSIAPADGQLKVEWQRYTRMGFRQYQVLKSYGNNYSVPVTTIEDNATTSWIDDAYVGGPVTYHIVTYATNSFNGLYSQPASYHYPSPSILEATYTSTNALTIKFSATPFYKNFREYGLTSEPDLYHYTFGISDTVVTFPDPGFGKNFTFKLAAYPRNTNQLPNWHVSFTEKQVAGYGTAWGPFGSQQMLQRPAINQFFTFSNDYFKTIDATTLQVKQSRFINFEQSYLQELNKNVVSEDAQYMYAILKDVLHQLNPVSLQTVATYQFKDLLPHTNYSNISIESVSNTNRLALVARGLFYRDSAFVVDMGQQKVLTKHRSNQFPKVASISPDGGMVRVNNELYKEQSNGSWQQQALPAHDLASLKFHPTKPWYVVVTGNTVRFYATATGALVKTLATEAILDTYDIDGASGYLYGFANNALYIYNTETGALKRKLGNMAPGSAFVYNDKIFAINNRYIPL
ncbi:hypothetical protein FVR03_04605 [Pontibacter qinzhouensis]|uniref:Fibronectin type-III domain-containing protein n=1 Tax=Pontibacter qinzhouensis TaxID=2603253 RepID=A0A5C8K9A9_9BACT|nr:hypothetical protein [Pontibacter qinzhouensis]TXK50773.1 hypothetical protein FVR03_04605 [Pontibacter qinzhouensis]